MENLVFLAFAGLRVEEKVKDYGVTSCVARNVNKYNLSEGYEGYRTFFDIYSRYLWLFH